MEEINNPCTRRGRVIVGLFTLVWMLRTIIGDPIPISVHLFILLLLVNTYYSIIFFSSIHPAITLAQQCTDVTLGALYIMLICSGSDSIWFLTILTVLFITAALKYTMGLTKSSYQSFLERKIIVDLWGALITLIALVISLHYTMVLTMWVGTIVFAIANGYVLWYRPLYLIPLKIQS